MEISRTYNYNISSKRTHGWLVYNPDKNCFLDLRVRHQYIFIATWYILYTVQSAPSIQTQTAVSTPRESNCQCFSWKNSILAKMQIQIGQSVHDNDKSA